MTSRSIKTTEIDKHLFFHGNLVTLRLLRGSRESFISVVPPTGSSSLKRNSFSPIMRSRNILPPRAYSLNLMAILCSSDGLTREKRKVSLKCGSEPLCTDVFCRCFLEGSSTMCTCQESIPLRALSGMSRAVITVISSFSTSGRYSRERSRSPHLEIGGRGEELAS